jgi:hypothetical protein
MAIAIRAREAAPLRRSAPPQGEASWKPPELIEVILIALDRSRSAAGFLQALLVLMLFAAPVAAQPAPPAPDPGAEPNIFYGEVPAGGEEAPVLVFIHGLRGVAADWWVGNDMYSLAFQAGYRTAFININADLTPNDASIVENAGVLVQLLPRIAARYQTPQFYVIAHSKGGVDAQAALLDPATSSLAKAVFMISPPNHGSELADWAFGPGQPVAAGLGLLTPGVFAMTTQTMAQFRGAADPVAAAVGAPYFTMAGNTFLGNPLTAITGMILSGLTGGVVNDGLVTVASTRLPTTYATDLGLVTGNHFNTNNGSVAFPRIQARIEELEGKSPFERIATDGFGDRFNSFAWSMKWFQGRLYVGTGRAFLCVTAATSDRQTGTHFYRPAGPDVLCAPTPEDLPLAAEIWRYTPVTKQWERVYRSPVDIPIVFDALGRPTKFTARDIAFRGMEVFREPDGTEALYVGGVSGSSVFDKNPPYGSSPGSFPPPRLLRSVDGLAWEAVPQNPGTFLGDIAKDRPGAIKVRGFRSLAAHAGRLWVTASDFRGVGVIFASANPAAGDNAWAQASPAAEVLPVWTLYSWNGYLYCTTGDRTSPVGYGVYKTRGGGPGPYLFQPVVTQGGFQVPQYRSPDALSIAALNGKLYVGSDRPTELIRIDANDTWEVVVGGPRLTPTGLKRPISGVLTGFGNLFNGHFWKMEAHADALYLGTWDWSVGLRSIPQLGPLFGREFGADLFKTRDGRYWSQVSRTGFGDGFNYGVRTLESTPAGLFVGTANPFYGLQIWHGTDISAGTAAAAASRAGATPSDLAGTDDAEERPEGPGAPKLPEAPAYLEAASRDLSGPTVLLTWERSKRGKQYGIYRSSPLPVLDTLPPDFVIEIPGTGLSFTIAQIRAGVLDPICNGMPTVVDCELVEAIKNNTMVPGPYLQIGTTDRLGFADDGAPSGVQSLYYVKAFDEEGRLSEASNMVGGPSAATAVTFGGLRRAVRQAVDAGQISKKGHLPAKLLNALDRAAASLADENPLASRRTWTSESISKQDRPPADRSADYLRQLLEHIDRRRGPAPESEGSSSGIQPGTADDLIALVRSLTRNVILVGKRKIDRSAILTVN